MKNDRTRYYNRLGEAATKLCAALGRARSADEDRLRVWHKFKGEIEQSIAGHRVALVLVLVPHRGEKPTARGTWGPDLGLGIRIVSANDQGEVHLVTVGCCGEDGKGGPSWDVQDAEICELDVAGTLAALGTSDDLETTLLVAHEELARLVGDGVASAGKAFPIEHLVPPPEACDECGEGVRLTEPGLSMGGDGRLLCAPCTAEVRPALEDATPDGPF